MMDYAPAVATDIRPEDGDLDRQRLDAFRLGSVQLASSSTQRSHRPSHSRSHSRHTSVSISVPPIPLSSSLSLPPMAANSPPASPPLPASGSTKRNSHHRRRSSVSTRHESAEMMGLTLPVITSNDDNISLGDKDSIRRRALLALEGKTDVGAFSKVEIPELVSPETEKRFDFPTKPSYPPGVGTGHGSGLNSIASSKRDSFGKFMSIASSKEQLGTLLEEEEEEEVLEKPKEAPVAHSPEPMTAPVEVTSASSVPARRRPTTLTLRPLSLTSNFIQATNGELPTPAPSPCARAGLRSLTLPISLSSEADDTPSNVASMPNRRHSMILSSSPSGPAIVSIRRPSLIVTDAPPLVQQVSRRSSISYVTSGDGVTHGMHGLPTPEMTPTSDRRHSQESTSSDQSRSSSRGSRSLSTNEHHFLYQAHAALVQRITDLERALSAQPPSRPQSCASDVSPLSDTASDEILQLVADLKAERDDLKKDVDGWRKRVADYDRQIDLLAKRVEAERCEAWLARERVNKMELEKKALEAVLAEKVLWGQDGWKRCDSAQAALSKVEEECVALRAELHRLATVEEESSRLTIALAEERKKREEAEKELESLLSTPTPQAFDLAKYATPPVSRTMIFARRGGLGFRSVDSSGSSTDVESLDDTLDRHQLSLKAVEEEEEDDFLDASRSDYIDSQDDLARYEEEEETDRFAFHASLSDTSFASDFDDSQGVLHPTDVSTDGEQVPDLSPCRSNSSSPAPPSPPQTHERRQSMIKAWTFPQSLGASSQLVREDEEIDRFFGCLEDVDNSPPLESRLRSTESEKNMFAQALANADDDCPFMIPSHIGTEVADSKSILDVLLEEDEDSTDVEDECEDVDEEYVGQEDEGGIVFTFTPPTTFGGSAVDVHFELPTVKVKEVTVASPPASVPQSSSLEQTKPTFVPRFSPPKPFSSNIPSPSASTPARSVVPRSTKTIDSPPASFAPIKRGPLCSAIPRPQSTQPASPPSPQVSAPAKPRTASFIPQPRKSPVSAVSTPPKTLNKARSSMYWYPRPEPSPTFAEVVTCSPAAPEPAPSSPFVSPTFAAIQTLTSFIPSLPWTSPKVGTPASSAASALCTIPFSSSASSIASLDDQGSTHSVTLSPVTMQPKPRGYVPRERQLAKLRIRLEQERRSASSNVSTGSGIHCRRYHGGIVDL